MCKIKLKKIVGHLLDKLRVEVKFLAVLKE